MYELPVARRKAAGRISSLMEPNLPIPAMQSKIREAIAKHADKQGVIILTDLFGATPANLCGNSCAKDRVEIITGCNLPMLLKAATASFETGVSETARQFASRVEAESPERAEAFARLTAHYERARFGAAALTVTEREEVSRALAALRTRRA